MHQDACAKFSGLSTINNFAKANGNVCVNQSVGKKLDVVTTDKAAFFNHMHFSSDQIIGSAILDSIHKHFFLILKEVGIHT